MRNLDTELDQRGVTRLVKRTAVTESVTVIPTPSTARSHLAKTGGTWDWNALRDYVVTEIERRFGPFPRYFEKEYGVFSSFLSRWGAEGAEAIARHAFEVCDGRWCGAPIAVARFMKRSDPYFAEVINQRIKR